ncbi:DUF3069 domain-containing protein [Ferrimonas marina]|uniref:DUF3069 domain-containing protein n=1 Tax=Ferrimonas marina TaxID=299255 RepID=A0A1M5NMN3_9GAMM|nr:DUF3069 domain-containing protein [Ferrimonas marina]SHG90213.1 Protein of unknown function [Ferrimonas marina]
MSEKTPLPQELQQVLNYMEVSEEQHEGLLSIYNAVEAPLRASWDQQPQSARNVMESFEQFQAIVTYTLAGPTAELLQMAQQNNEGEELSEEQADAMLQQLFSQGIKMMIKDLKSARRDASLRNEFLSPFRA